MTLELLDTGGLYRFSNVTYRGVQVGKVTAVGPTATGAKATLQLDTSPKIPVDVHASVRSMSAVGEQYVDLVPRSEPGPFLRDGSVIAARDTSIPRPVGPMLDKLSALVKSTPKDKLGQLLDESFPRVQRGGATTWSGRSTRPARSRATRRALSTTPAPWSTTANRSWMRRPKPPTRRGGGRTTWPASPTRWTPTMRSSASCCTPNPAPRRRFRDFWTS